MDSLEKQCTAIDEYIEKINTSIEFLQEKKRNGEHLDADKEAYISSAIRLKVQKGMDKKPLRTRIEEIPVSYTHLGGQGRVQTARR